MSVVYIAGRITGDPDYKEKFMWAEESLKERGFTVLNPAVLPKGLTSEDYMRISIAMMQSADCVVFLPGWGASRGAQLEMQWCYYTGKPHSTMKDFLKGVEKTE